MQALLQGIARIAELAGHTDLATYYRIALATCSRDVLSCELPDPAEGTTVEALRGAATEVMATLLVEALPRGHKDGSEKAPGPEARGGARRVLFQMVSSFAKTVGRVPMSSGWFQTHPSEDDVARAAQSARQARLEQGADLTCSGSEAPEAYQQPTMRELQAAQELVRRSPL